MCNEALKISGEYEFDVISRKRFVDVLSDTQKAINDGWEVCGIIMKEKRWNFHPHCEGWEDVYSQPIRRFVPSEELLRRKEAERVASEREQSEWNAMPWYKKLWEIIIWL